MIALLSAIRSDLSNSLREAIVGSERKRDIGRVWDHLQDAEAILRDVDLIERQPPTIQSLEAILNSEDTRPVKINPDGTVSPL